MKKNIILVALAALVLLVGGRSISYALEYANNKEVVEIQTTDNDVVEDATDNKTVDNTETTTTYIGEAKAKSLAFTHAGVKESEVSKLVVTLDYDDGVAEYEVDFYVGTTEYDYEINAVSGAIISSEKDVEEVKTSTTNTTTTTTTTYIGEAKAKSLAFTHAGVKESEVSKLVVTLDYDDGVAEYEVDFYVGTTEYDYEINAVSGVIISSEKDVEEVKTTSTTTTTYIGEAKAKSIALAHAGVKESEVSRLQVSFDNDDGVSVYELEWNVGNAEYEYEINATSGSIIESSKEID